MKKRVALIMAFVLVVMSVTGCGGNDDTVQTYVVSNESLLEQSELEAAKQPDSLCAGEEVYASIHFIESPQGMEYSVKWYLNDIEIKEEKKATQKGPQDIVVYGLEAENVENGILKVKVCYQKTVLSTREIPIK